MKRLILGTAISVVVVGLGFVLIAKAWTNLTVSGSGSTPTLAQVTAVGATTADNVLLTGGVSSTSYIANPGSSASPSYTFSGDEDTGIYGTSDIIRLAAGGSQVAYFSGGASGLLTLNPLGGNNTNDIGYSNQSWKNIYASGTLNVGGTIYATSGSIAYGFSGDEDTYISHASDQINILTGGSARLGLHASGNVTYSYFRPDATNARDLGGSDYSWKNIYASGTAYLGGEQVVNGGTTSTIFVGTNAGKRGQECLGDQDGVGFTCITGNNGVITSYSTSTY